MVDDEMEFDFEEIQKYKIPEIEKSWKITSKWNFEIHKDEYHQK
jgi:hypothetical protein